MNRKEQERKKYKSCTRNKLARKINYGSLELSAWFNKIESVHPRTKRQKEVLDYITGFVDKNGYEPSYQQIARRLGVSSRGGIQRHIAALENQGLITRRRENGSFGIELRLQKLVTESVCDVELWEVDEDNVIFNRSLTTIPRHLVGPLAPDEIFAFRVPDDSMIENQICGDDVVFFEKRSYARRGETVLVRSDDGQVLLGRYYHHGLETEIRRANAEFEPVIFPSDEVVIQGAMRGLMRFAPVLSD